MSLRLRIASLWIPNFILKKELDNVAINTIEGLNDVLKQHAPEKMKKIAKKDEILKGSLEERRIVMVKAHNIRVKSLIEVLGYENAVKVARKSMFDVGYQLGQEARRKLGVGNDFKDLELAARLLYKILGIDFKIENKGGNIIMSCK